ncbi:6-phospho-beta-glucosidase [Anaerovirgula multivorans]|uniref:6-phospho-beta-glucosidase n=1 Tax=Anaerovirgula multivorans TaxID=312168 RepID=A0A239DIQ6_9FIRM|nr:6-phospho-beta-glucosidase [Anaerovirgula multivorans]SNS31593.1 6-phospho-beta-glucosidase [Anaerovirgula multivorans]
MKKAIKIATIGGGSSYTPELIEGFIKRYKELPISEIWLVDVEDGKEKLEIVGRLAQRMWDATPYNVKVITTLNRKEALKDADFVTTQFRVGLLDARIKDERIPLLHRMLGQETNGAGGMFKAFRTIPVMKEIVEDMKELCPDAWLINFTNPSGIITEAVIKHFGWKKCIGLCNVPVIAMMNEPKVIGKQVSELNYQFAGLNHFHWHKVFDEDGIEVTGQLIDHINEKNGGTPANIYLAEFSLELLHSMNLLPCGYHRYYYSEKEMLEHSIEEFEKGGTRAEQMKEVEASLFEIYKNPNLNVKPEELQKRGGAYYSEAACECISAIYNNKGIHMVVSTQNNGAIPCLNSDSIIEISCLISAKGATPIAWGKMGAFEKGHLQIMKAMEECTISAALLGDYGVALQAFTINPLIQKGGEAKKVLDELLVVHEKYLPQFKEKISELKKRGVESKDSIVADLMKNGH